MFSGGVCLKLPGLQARCMLILVHGREALTQCKGRKTELEALRESMVLCWERESGIQDLGWFISPS